MRLYCTLYFSIFKLDKFCNFFRNYWMKRRRRRHRQQPPLPRLPRCPGPEQLSLELMDQGWNYGQGILKGEVSLYSWPPVWLVWNQLNDNWQIFIYLQNRLIQTSQTGGQCYSDTSPCSIPCLYYKCVKAFVIPSALFLASVVNYHHKWCHNLEDHLLTTLESSFVVIICL